MPAVQYKTPGVYVQEIDAFPPSIVGVETAVPAFIGYTRAAERNGRSVALQPVRIGSMADYRAIFGGPYEPRFAVIEQQPAYDKAKTKADGTKQALTAAQNAFDTAAEADKPAKKADLETAIKANSDAQGELAFLSTPDVSIGGTAFVLDGGKSQHFMFNSLRLFYANGGGDCYIVSVGKYSEEKAQDVVLKDFQDGLEAVEDLVGPTMLVIPEAVLLKRDDYRTLTTKMLKQCLTKQDRVAILDIWAPPGFTEKTLDDVVQDFREGLSAVPSGALKYGMAYAPFLRTSIVDPSELDYTNFAEFQDGKPGPLTWALLNEANRLFPDDSNVAPKQLKAPGAAAATPTGGAATTPAEGAAATPAADGAAKATETSWLPAGTTVPANTTVTTRTETIVKSYFEKMAAAKKETDVAVKVANTEKINQGLASSIPALKEVYAAMAAKLGTLPPSGAMAGVYAQNDTLRGVWNAPANVGLNAVVAPMLKFSNKMQENLNMPIDGLAINAIRSFVGRGTLVWGARTLDGNSNDWRYIQVRRTLIYIEQSVELALNKFVFEPNVAQTWVTVASMVGSFLRGLWSAGGLMGASPAEAYSVQCGLGSTMTAQDVLEGRMIVQIKLQMVRPAEFIVLTFQQQMQGGAA